MHIFFFFNDTATTEIYTLSLHDALPIYKSVTRKELADLLAVSSMTIGRDLKKLEEKGYLLCTYGGAILPNSLVEDRKSTRLNSSHANISYAVFCLKKKKKTHYYQYMILN